ncbi:MAG: ABC transporter substrate-binding protein [Aquisalimonadaceae bacterium]
MRLSNLLRRAIVVPCVALVLLGGEAVAADLRKVTVGALFLSADAGLFVARDRGYFEDQGLDVQLTRFTSGADIIALAGTNQVDVGSGSLTPGLLNALRRGIGLKIVSSKSVIKPDFGVGSFIVRSELVDSGDVESLADLKGRRVAVNNIQSTSLNYVVRALEVGGLTQEDVELVEMPFNQFIPAFKRGAVDAAIVYSPLSDVMTSRMKVAVAFPEAGLAETANGDVTNLMFYSPAFAASEDGKRFMIAHLKGMRDYHDVINLRRGDPTEICKIIDDYTSNVPDKCQGITMSGVDANGLVNVDSLERYQREWNAWGLMGSTIDIAEHVDMRFLEHAWQELGKR